MKTDVASNRSVSHIAKIPECNWTPNAHSRPPPLPIKRPAPQLFDCVIQEDRASQGLDLHNYPTMNPSHADICQDSVGF